MKIATNPIELQMANESEITSAKGICKDLGSAFVLVSYSAFPGFVSFYKGLENESGEIESVGWIGKL